MDKVLQHLTVFLKILLGHREDRRVFWLKMRFGAEPKADYEVRDILPRL